MPHTANTSGKPPVIWGEGGGRANHLRHTRAHHPTDITVVVRNAVQDLLLQPESGSEHSPLNKVCRFAQIIVNKFNNSKSRTPTT